MIVGQRPLITGFSQKSWLVSYKGDSGYCHHRCRGCGWCRPAYRTVCSVAPSVRHIPCSSGSGRCRPPCHEPTAGCHAAYRHV